MDALSRGRVDAPIALVVAHPDDETVALGGLMDRFARLRMIHITDGAPFDMADAARAGFSTREAYGEARGAELEAALEALGVWPERRSLELPDQTAVENLAAVARTLTEALEGCAAVITHAYEGGHPDHDACAFAVQAACRLMPAKSARLEAPFYHSRGGERVVARFWADPACPETCFALSPERLEAKRAALRAHRTQAAVLAWFEEPEVERLRPAPDYDFTAPPPPGEALYDRWGWTLTSDRWRAAAARALAELDLGR